MIFQIGRPAAVSAGANMAANGTITLAAQFGFADGGVGTLFASTNRPHFSVHATVLGTNEAYAVIDSLHEVKGYGFAGDRKRHGRNWIERHLDTGYHHAGYQTELELFLKAIAHSELAHPSFADEVPIYRVIDEIERQVNETQKVHAAGRI